jgi:flavin-dependent dehydrogenase
VIDLLVVGGGPVGLVTAINAAMSGLSVAVLEPRTNPVDKACGEGLMPDALTRLHRIGVDPPGAAIRGIRYAAGGSEAHAYFSGEPGRGVRRTVLHEVLAQRARELGVRAVDTRAGAITQGRDSIETAGVEARYLVGADGLHSPVRRSLGLDRPVKGARRFGVRQHFQTPTWTDLVEVHWLPDCEVYVTPVAEGLVGVAALGTSPLDLPAAIARIPSLAAQLDGATPASPLRGAGPLRQRATSRTAGRALLVGDAAGYVDALTGEGLRVGFAEAEAAVRAIVAEEPEGYERQWRSITRSYRWLTTGLLWSTSRSWLRPAVVPIARRQPAAFRRIVDSLAY